MKKASPKKKPTADFRGLGVTVPNAKKKGFVPFKKGGKK
jgi:hypothetical protein